MSQARYSLHGAWECFRLLRGYSQLPKGCIPGHKHIAVKLKSGESTVRGWIRRLKSLGAIKVEHRGPRSSLYTILWRDCSTWTSFQQLIEENERAFPRLKDQPVTAENERACERTCERAFHDQSPQQHTPYAEFASNDGRAFPRYSSSEKTLNSMTGSSQKVGVVDETDARVIVSPRAPSVPFPEVSKLSPPEGKSQRQPDPNPEHEMKLRLQERHPSKWEDCLKFLREDVLKFGLNWSDVIAIDSLRTKHPAALRDPVAYYRSLPRKAVRDATAAVREKARVTWSVQEAPQCAKCRFGVMTDGQFCDCASGKDLTNLEKRKQARAAPAQRQDVA